jgi:hypothetical protein
MVAILLGYVDVDLLTRVLEVSNPESVSSGVIERRPARELNAARHELKDGAPTLSGVLDIRLILLPGLVQAHKTVTVIESDIPREHGLESVEESTSNGLISSSHSEGAILVNDQVVIVEDHLQGLEEATGLVFEEIAHAGRLVLSVPGHWCHAVDCREETAVHWSGESSVPQEVVHAWWIGDCRWRWRGRGCRRERSGRVGSVD